MLDIPEQAHTIHCDFRLKRRGTLWAKDFQLDAIGPEIKTTERSEARAVGKPGFQLC